MENLELYKQLLLVQSHINIWAIILQILAGIVGICGANIFSLSNKKRRLTGIVFGVIAATMFVIAVFSRHPYYTAQLSDVTVNLSKAEYEAIKSYQDKNSSKINELEVRSLIELILNDSNRFEK